MTNNTFSHDLGDLDAGKLKAVTVGLKEGEIASLEQIAASLGLTRNSLLRYIIRHFLIEYQAGETTVEVEERVTRFPKLP